jgi:hypothetical protein
MYVVGKAGRCMSLDTCMRRAAGYTCLRQAGGCTDVLDTDGYVCVDGLGMLTG